MLAMIYAFQWSLEKLVDGDWTLDPNQPPLPWEPVLAGLAEDPDFSEESASIHLYNLATHRKHCPEASGPSPEGGDPKEGWITVAAILDSDWDYLPFRRLSSRGTPVAVRAWLERLAVLQPVEPYRYAFRMQYVFDLCETQLLERLGGLQESAKQSTRRGGR